MTVEDWAEIRRLHVREAMSVRAIARHLGIACQRRAKTDPLLLIEN